MLNSFSNIFPAIKYLLFKMSSKQIFRHWNPGVNLINEFSRKKVLNLPKEHYFNLGFVAMAYLRKWAFNNLKTVKDFLRQNFFYRIASWSRYWMLNDSKRISLAKNSLFHFLFDTFFIFESVFFKLFCSRCTLFRYYKIWRYSML
jgi:hypothetical protein